MVAGENKMVFCANRVNLSSAFESHLSHENLVHSSEATDFLF